MQGETALVRVHAGGLDALATKSRGKRVLNGGEVESEGRLAQVVEGVALVPQDEVALLVEDQAVGEGVEEEVEVQELSGPGLGEVGESEGTPAFDD